MNLPKLNRNKGRVPPLYIKARTIPEAWEKTLIEIWNNGVDIETDYDVEGAKEPPSRENAVLVEVTEPFAEPRIHRHIPEGIDSLQKYDMEVRSGLHDHWVKIIKDDGTPIWDYSYHERLFAWPSYDKNGNLIKTNQIEDVIEKLVKEKHITKSAQAITWLPTSDHIAGHSPCLQRVKFRLIRDEKGIYNLNMLTTWRSRDHKNAWFENVYGFTGFQADVAEELSNRLGEEVKVGNYLDFSDSLHIYGRDFNPFKVLAPTELREILGAKTLEEAVELLRTGPPITSYDKFLDLIEKYKREPIESRTWESNEPLVKQLLEEERVRLLADPDYTRKGGDEAKPEITYTEDIVIKGVKLPNGLELKYEPEPDRLNYSGGKLFLPDGTRYKPELLTT